MHTRPLRGKEKENEEGWLRSKGGDEKRNQYEVALFIVSLSFQ